jgi:hypothetical protein
MHQDHLGPYDATLSTPLEVTLEVGVKMFGELPVAGVPNPLPLPEIPVAGAPDLSPLKIDNNTNMKTMIFSHMNSNFDEI